MRSFNDFSYGSAKTHLEVTEAILGGYGGNDFREFFEETSGAKLAGGGVRDAVVFAPVIGSRKTIFQ